MTKTIYRTKRLFGLMILKGPKAHHDGGAQQQDAGLAVLARF